MRQRRSYAQFSVEEFIADDFFLLSIRSPFEEYRLFWSSFLLDHPHKKAEWEEAVKIVALMAPSKSSFDKRRDEDLQKLLKVLEELPVEFKQQGEGISTIFNIFIQNVLRWQVAGGFLLALIIAGLIWKDRTVNFSAPLGKLVTITLPDSSRVVLRGGSTLSYKPGWNKLDIREIWIDGEGYFNIVHLNQKNRRVLAYDRFVVHAVGAEVEVLGTEFDLYAHADHVRLSLKQGSVAFRAAHKAVYLRPGESVRFSRAEKSLQKNKAEPGVNSWLNGVVTIHESPLSNVLESLKQHYGWTIYVADSALLNQSISGEIPVITKKDMLLSLSTLLHAKIVEQRENTFLIKAVSDQ